MTRRSLADQQAALVAALVSGAPDPPGVDPEDLAATRRQLLDKRARVVAGCWPELAAAFGSRWRSDFAAWAAGRAPEVARIEGLRFAADLVTGPTGVAGTPAAALLVAAAMLRRWRVTGHRVTRRRLPRLPGARPARSAASGSPP